VQVQPRFPEQDVDKFRRKESYYEAAAVCRRGHVETEYIKPFESHADDEKCVKCGATVLIGCVSCGLRIRGDYYAPGVFVVNPNRRLPSFCDGCGAAHPWASREERIHELENILDEEDIDESDRVLSMIGCGSFVKPRASTKSGSGSSGHRSVTGPEGS
jgi:hypothetical protein